MRKIAAIALLLSVFSSCTYMGDEKPKNVLSKDTMAVVLADVHMAEALLFVRNIYGDQGNQTVGSHYEYIYKIHHITRQQWEISYKYYSEHPAELSKIYDEVLNILNKKEVEAAKR
jgi:hypothetical protein